MSGAGRRRAGAPTPQLAGHVIQAARDKSAPRRPAKRCAWTPGAAAPGRPPSGRSTTCARWRRWPGGWSARRGRSTRAMCRRWMVGDSGIDAAEIEGRAERTLAALAGVDPHGQADGPLDARYRRAGRRAAGLAGQAGPLRHRRSTALGCGDAGRRPRHPRHDSAARSKRAHRACRPWWPPRMPMPRSAPAWRHRAGRGLRRRLRGAAALQRHRRRLGRRIAASTAVQGGDALAVQPWFTRAARARCAGALSVRRSCRRGPGTGERLAPAGGAAAARRRRALGRPAGDSHQRSPRGGCRSWCTRPTLDPAEPMAGLLVDEWVEVVPASSETTGIAFQHDPPESRAPQALLLAVPPVPDQPWTLGTCTACCSRRSTGPSCAPSMPRVWTTPCPTPAAQRLSASCRTSCRRCTSRSTSMATASRLTLTHSGAER